MRKRGLIPKRRESKSRWHSLEEYESALRLSCGFKSECARILNVAPASVTSRIDKSEHLQNVLAEISEQALDFSEKQLFSAIAAREGWAILFHLRCKGKSRGWQERQQMDVTVRPAGGVLQVPYQFASSEEFEKVAIEQQRQLLEKGVDNDGHEKHDNDSRYADDQDDSDAFDVEEEPSENFIPDFETAPFDQGAI